LREIYSGSYWPGDIYVIRETAKGEFAASETLKRADGKPVNAGPPWESEKKPQMQSLASAPWLVDHDGDGDLDFYIGNIEGGVMLVLNEGDAKNPKFANSATAVEAGGVPIKVEGGDAGPTVGDWDGDGRLDLLVGGGDGSVTLFRNTSKSGAATYAAGRELVGKSSIDFEKPVAAGAQPTGPGTRVKLCVTDWNGDGLADLLLGDVFYQQSAVKLLTDEQTKRRDALRQERERLVKALNPGEVGEDFDWEKFQEAHKSEYEKLTKLAEELEPLEDRSSAVGTVWVFPRKPAQN
jgi:hypothetical protein